MHEEEERVYFRFDVIVAKVRVPRGCKEASLLGLAVLHITCKEQENAAIRTATTTTHQHPISAPVGQWALRADHIAQP